MNDMTTFEQQLASGLDQLAGPRRHVDAMAISRSVTATTTSRRWRFQSMFSATKFVVAGAIVALFGGFLLIAQPFDRQAGNVPGAATDGDRPAIEKVTGQFVSVVRGGRGDALPDFTYGVDRSAPGHDCSVADRCLFLEYYRNEAFSGRAEMNDERLSGEVTMTHNVDLWGDEDAARPSVNWGTVAIENDAGAWTGTHTSVNLDVPSWTKPAEPTAHALEDPTVEFWELVGSGAYEGWSAILYAGRWSDDEGEFQDAPVYGAVFSGSLPPDRESYLPISDWWE